MQGRHRAPSHYCGRHRYQPQHRIRGSVAAWLQLRREAPMLARFEWLAASVAGVDLTAAALVVLALP